MPDDDTQPTSVVQPSTSVTVGRLLRTAAWVIPLVVLIVIIGLVLLSLFSPVTSTNYHDYIRSAL